MVSDVTGEDRMLTRFSLSDEALDDCIVFSLYDEVKPQVSKELWERVHSELWGTVGQAIFSRFYWAVCKRVQDELWDYMET